MSYPNNIMTYLKWRGDLSVSDVPFNEVDALVLAEMSYVAFDGIVPGVNEKKSVTVREAAKAFEKKGDVSVKQISTKLELEVAELLHRMANSKRFGSMKLSNYVSQIDYERAKQFAAIHIEISPSLVYIAFRGTDDELIGWKENLNLSCLMPVPSQKSAVNYVNRTATGFRQRYWIGGHSKGGNLAIYASTFCNPTIQKKIQRIYSFDGPGFMQNMVDDPSYKKIEDLIIAYVPESSVVGMILEHQEKHYVVRSGQTGFLQHDAMSWKVNHERLVRTEVRDQASHLADETFTGWLARIDTDHRKQFIDALFGVFDKAEIHYMSDLKSINLKNLIELIKAMSARSPEDREIMSKIISLLWEEANKSRKEERNIRKITRKEIRRNEHTD